MIDSGEFIMACIDRYERLARRACGCSIAAFLLLVPLLTAGQRLVPTPTGFGRDGDQMGKSVAILGDTFVVGSPLADLASVTDSGAAQVFRNGSSGWEREAILAPSHLAFGNAFGNEVAIGSDLVAIGTQGSALETFVFRRNGTVWAQSDEMTFGSHPAISGDTLAIGGRTAVRVYVDQAGTWIQQADLPIDGEDLGERVTGVAISDDVIAFSTAVPNGLSLETVQLYIYARSSDVWTRDTKLDRGTYLAGIGPAPGIGLSGESAILFMGDSVEVRTRGDGAWDIEQELDPGVPWSDLPPLSVAIDGDRAVVGCTGDIGSTIVFERNAGVWSRVSRPYDVDAGPGSTFGASVALSGENMLVGSPGAVGDNVISGKATPILVNGTSWTAAPSVDEGNAHAGEYFGTAVAMSGLTAFVTSSLARVEGAYSGVVYVYELMGGQWRESTRLTPPSSNNGASFGPVAPDGDTAAIGSHADRFDGSTSWNAVYIYGRDGDGWQPEQRIESDVPLGAFGLSLALDGDRLAVGDPGDTGAAGRAVAFHQSGGTWSQQGTIVPGDSAAGDDFGWAMALSGNTLAIGAPFANSGIDTRAGAAYVFVDAGGTWQQQARLTAPIPLQDRAFGNSIAIAGDTLIVGAGRPTGPDSEAAFVFVRDGTDWTHEATLSAPDSSDHDFQAGFAVAISADASVAIVGAPAGTADAVDAGVAYVYRRDGSTWSLASTVNGHAYPGPDNFGGSVAISGSSAIVGAPGEPIGGAAYVIPLGDPLFADGFDG